MHTLDEISNYYEQLVKDYFNAESLYTQYDTDFLADLFCLTLNKLPPRYIRYAVDMAFFLSSEERAEMAEKVARTVQEYLVYLEARRDKELAAAREVAEEQALVAARRAQAQKKQEEIEIAKQKALQEKKIAELYAEKEKAEAELFNRTPDKRTKKE